MPAKKKPKMKKKSSKKDISPSDIKPVDIQKALTKVLVGVINGAELDTVDCIALVKHIRKMEDLLEMKKEMMGTE